MTQFKISLLRLRSMLEKGDSQQFDKNRRGLKIVPIDRIF